MVTIQVLIASIGNMVAGNNFKWVKHKIYCISGNNRGVLIFANFARRTNSRIQEF